MSTTRPPSAAPSCQTRQTRQTNQTRRARRPLASLAAGTTALAVATAVAAFAGTGTASAAPATPPLPRTGFELSGGAKWTTQPQEQTFLRALTISRRISLTTLSRTKQGRPIQLITIGQPSPPDPARIARGSAVLFLGSQHGDEPSGREATLKLARDLAFATDPATTALLRTTTVMIVPSANPDGTAANTRENADKVDINRDHLRLTSNETRAYAKLIRDYKPDLVHDLHEYGPTPRVYDRQLIHLWPRNRNVDKGLYDVSKRLNESYVGKEVSGIGYSTGIYGIHYGPNGEPIAQVAGDGQERILRNTAGLRHAMGILVEANNSPTTPGEKQIGAALNLRRVRTQGLAATASLHMFRAERTKIATATAKSVANAIRNGKAGNVPFAFGGADNQLPTPDQVDTTPPCGYRLTSAQYTTVKSTLDLHGVATKPAGDSVTVSMAQAAQPVIPLLLDKRAQYGVVKAAEIPCAKP